ncbi:type II secretion system protein GspL [Vibrio olivae]|uniref:Type II secretion system protein L n=1 Tax=Vibrio olivae TaxID=1243002 RepID=A0ABV5HQX1_9VIBR
MNEFLIVRLSSNKASPVQWLAWSELQKAVIASGEVANWDAIPELTPYAELRNVILLVSSQDVINHTVEIPPGGARQFESMLPYLLEDELAQDVDELHFSIISKQAGVATVCAIEKSWFRDCLTYLASCGLSVKQVLPDAFALPTEDGQISAVEIADQWLLKKSAYQAIGVDGQWLSMIAASDWVKQDEQFLPLVAYSPLPALSLAPEQEWRNGEPSLVMELLAQGALQSKINLLSGEFKAKSSLGRYWKIWQKVAVAAAVLLVVSMGHNWLVQRNLQAQADEYRQESERIFRSVTGKRRIPTVSYLRREMDSEINLLSGGSQSDTVLTWWNKLPQALSSVKSLSINSLRYDSDRQELHLEASSKDFETFESAREALANQFVVEQGQLNRSGELVNGTFVLKRRTGADG